jgi:S-adenosylmethionine decarboxylase
MNRDCWYLYTLNPLEGDNNKKRHRGIPEPDQTLEILMSDLDPEVMNIFTREESSSAAEATQVCITTLLPHAQEHNYNRVSTSGENVYQKLTLLN